jgi:hypothetical protein
MMTPSVGLLYSARHLLDWIARRRCGSVEVVNECRRVLVASADETLNLCVSLGWVRVAADGCLFLSTRGTELIGEPDGERVLRQQLLDVIVVMRPSWRGLLGRGRVEASRFFDRDTRQMFVESGLLATADDDVVDWWDTVSGAVRSGAAVESLQTGRRGERLTLAAERSRTEREPVWQSVESNLCGYDVLSIVRRGSTMPLRIEVKASSETIEYARFFISRSEWEAALSGSKYVFHVWALKPSVRVATLSVADVESHIPSDRGLGEWQQTTVRYAVFADRFSHQPVDLAG